MGLWNVFFPFHTQLVANCNRECMYFLSAVRQVLPLNTFTAPYVQAHRSTGSYSIYFRQNADNDVTVFFVLDSNYFLSNCDYPAQNWSAESYMTSCLIWKIAICRLIQVQACNMPFQYVTLPRCLCWLINIWIDFQPRSWLLRSTNMMSL